jgi:hypothetical protein
MVGLEEMNKIRSLMLQNEVEIENELRKAFDTRTQMNLDRARWTFSVILRLSEFPDLDNAEKSRLFGEFKCFCYLQHKFRDEFLVKEFEDYTARIKENIFQSTPTIQEFWVNN